MVSCLHRAMLVGLVLFAAAEKVAHLHDTDEPIAQLDHLDEHIGEGMKFSDLPPLESDGQFYMGTSSLERSLGEGGASSDDWRSDAERNMQCTIADGESDCSMRSYHGMGTRMEECLHIATSCEGAENEDECNSDPSQYGITDPGSIFNVTNGGVTMVTSCGKPTAASAVVGLPANDLDLSKPDDHVLPSAPRLAPDAECAFTIYRKMHVPAKTRTTVSYPACCVGSGCTSDNACIKNPALCKDFDCVVEKWSRCEVAPNSRLEWRYRVHEKKCRQCPWRQEGSYSWYAQVKDLQCKSHKTCSCTPPESLGEVPNLQKACLQTAAKSMCAAQ